MVDTALAQRDLLKIPEQVLDELSVQKDELYEWCRERKDVLCYETTDQTEEVFAELVNKYPHMTGKLGLGENYADLYVVALAKIHNASVVTYEKFNTDTHPQNYKITNVCHEESIDFITPYEFIRREGWVFKHL